jgi:serine/threonine protein kinase
MLGFKRNPLRNMGQENHTRKLDNAKSKRPNHTRKAGKTREEQAEIVRSAAIVLQYADEYAKRDPSWKVKRDIAYKYLKDQREILDDMATDENAPIKTAPLRINRPVQRPNNYTRLNKAPKALNRPVHKMNDILRLNRPPKAPNRPSSPMEAPTCFKDLEQNITTNTANRHLCDKHFTRRVVAEGGELDSIYATRKVIGAGSFGAVMNAEIRFHNKSGQPFKCVGVYKVSKRPSPFLDQDTATEIACYARLLSKPCLSKGIFVKLARSDNKSVMENYLTDLEHIFRPGFIPREANMNMLVKAVSYQMLTGLRGMHEERIMHRDIKPANTFIAYDGEILLGDFGLSYNTAIGFKNQNKFYGYAGTPMYMAPEVLVPYLGPKSDLWSIGACIYEFLTGSPLMGRDFQAPRGDPIPPYTSYVSRKLANLRVNEDAKSLITALLNSNQALRPSAERCLEHAWFDGMNLHSAQETVVRSLNGLCMIKAKEKIHNTLKRTNAGVIKNDESNAFMRIHEGAPWSARDNDMRDAAVKALFDAYVVRSNLPLIKYLHAVELFDRIISVDSSVVMNASAYILSCVAIADLLSSDGHTSGPSLFTSTKIASTVETILRKPTTADSIEQIMRKIIRLLGGDIFILRNGLASQVVEANPKNGADFISVLSKLLEVRIMDEPIDQSFRSFAEKYMPRN